MVTGQRRAHLSGKGRNQAVRGKPDRQRRTQLSVRARVSTARQRGAKLQFIAEKQRKKEEEEDWKWKIFLGVCWWEVCVLVIKANQLGR